MNDSSRNKLMAIFLIVLIDVLGMTIMLPLLPFYSERFGASPFVVGLLVSSYAICQFISGPILGYLSDKYGRRPVLIFSQIGTLIGFLILAFSQSLTWIFISRVIDGLTAGNISTAQAYIADHTSPAERTKAMGKISIAFSFGFFIGPAISAFLMNISMRAPILLAAALSLTSIIASYKFLKENPREVIPEEKKIVKRNKNPFSFIMDNFSYLKNKNLQSLFLQIFLFYLAFSAYMSGFALFAERQLHWKGNILNPDQIGYAFTYFGLIGIITQLLVLDFATKIWKDLKVVAICFFLCVLGYLLLSRIHDAIFLIFTGLLISMGSGLIRPLLISEISKNAGPAERGRVIGVNQSLQSVAQVVAPMFSTYLIQRSLLSMWPIASAVLSFLGLGFTLFQMKKLNLK